MRLLLFYGLIQLGLLQGLWAKTNSKHSLSPIDLIVPPDPDDLNSDDDGKKDDPTTDLIFGVFENGINLCANMADDSMLPHAGNCSLYILCQSNSNIQTQNDLLLKYDNVSQIRQDM